MVLKRFKTGRLIVGCKKRCRPGIIKIILSEQCGSLLSLFSRRTGVYIITNSEISRRIKSNMDKSKNKTIECRKKCQYSVNW